MCMNICKVIAQTSFVKSTFVKKALVFFFILENYLETQSIFPSDNFYDSCFSKLTSEKQKFT